MICSGSLPLLSRIYGVYRMLFVQVCLFIIVCMLLLWCIFHSLFNPVFLATCVQWEESGPEDVGGQTFT